MDHTKAEVAAAVRRACYGAVRADLVSLMIVKDEDLDVTLITDLETSIRVRTPQGPRYFTVKVSERY